MANAPRPRLQPQAYFTRLATTPPASLGCLKRPAYNPSKQANKQSWSVGGGRDTWLSRLAGRAGNKLHRRCPRWERMPLLCPPSAVKCPALRRHIAFAEGTHLMRTHTFHNPHSTCGRRAEVTCRLSSPALSPGIVVEPMAPSGLLLKPLPKAGFMTTRGLCHSATPRDRWRLMHGAAMAGCHGVIPLICAFFRVWVFIYL